MDGLPELRKLSTVDSRLRSLRAEKGALPGIRDEFAQRRRDADASLEAARHAVVNAEQEQRRHEADAEDQQALHRKLEGQQHQVKSNDAYTALLAEMEQAKDATSRAETLVLEAMETLEASREALARAEAGVAELVESITDEEKACDSREASLDSEVARLESERASLTQGLDPAVVKTYERATSRRDPAVAVVTGEMCSGCRVGIPAQDFIEILTAKRLITCGTCQRLLLHEKHVGSDA